MERKNKFWVFRIEVATPITLAFWAPFQSWDTANAARSAFIADNERYFEVDIPMSAPNEGEAETSGHSHEAQCLNGCRIWPAIPVDPRVFLHPIAPGQEPPIRSVVATTTSAEPYAFGRLTLSSTSEVPSLSCSGPTIDAIGSPLPFLRQRNGDRHVP